MEASRGVVGHDVHTLLLKEDTVELVGNLGRLEGDFVHFIMAVQGQQLHQAFQFGECYFGL